MSTRRSIESWRRWLLSLKNLTAPSSISHLRKASGTPHEEGGHVSADQFKGSGAIVFWSNFLFGYERNQIADDPAERNTTTFRVLKDRNTGLATGCTFKLWYDHPTGRWREKMEEDGIDEDVL